MNTIHKCAVRVSINECKRTRISHLVSEPRGWQSSVRLCRRKAGRGRGAEVRVVTAPATGSQPRRSVLGPSESSGRDAALEKSETLRGSRPSAGMTASSPPATSHAIMAEGGTSVRGRKKLVLAVQIQYLNF